MNTVQGFIPDFEFEGGRGEQDGSSMHKRVWLLGGSGGIPPAPEKFRI